MGVISPFNDNHFKSADFIFSKVKRDLSSFDAAGLLDEGEFPEYVKECMRMLGFAVYKEEDAILYVHNYKAKLPEDFKLLYAAYKCSPYVEARDIAHLQGQAVSVYSDVTWEILNGSSHPEINVTTTPDKDAILNKITTRHYVKDNAVVINYRNPILLHLSPNVKGDRLADDCQNKLAQSIHEISLSNGQLHANFTQDAIYMKYYAFARDEDGVPMVPDIERVERAIEWSIKYNVLHNWWMNNAVPDLQNRWQEAEKQYNYWMAEARYELKSPSFAEMVNKVRRNREVNKVQIFAHLNNGYRY